MLRSAHIVSTFNIQAQHHLTLKHLGDCNMSLLTTFRNVRLLSDLSLHCIAPNKGKASNITAGVLYKNRLLVNIVSTS